MHTQRAEAQTCFQRKKKKRPQGETAASADLCAACGLTNRVSFFPGQDNETAKLARRSEAKVAVAAHTKSQMLRSELKAGREKERVSCIHSELVAKSAWWWAQCSAWLPCRATPPAFNLAPGVWPHMACCHARGFHFLGRTRSAPAVRRPCPTLFNSVLSTRSHLMCSCLLRAISFPPLAMK